MAGTDPRATIATSLEGRSKERVQADLSVDGALGNAAVVGGFSAFRFPEYSLTETALALQALIQASKNGDTGLADTLLIAQASSLNAIYLECVRRAAEYMNQLEPAEVYLRLGLKAQAQCRTTLESLAKIKNPPNATFVRQANIANGPQQVNNGAPQVAGGYARPEETANAPIELLENSHGEWVDTRATGAAGRGDPAMATLGQVQRAEDDGREAGGKA